MQAEEKRSISYHISRPFVLLFSIIWSYIRWLIVDAFWNSRVGKFLRRIGLKIRHIIYSILSKIWFFIYLLVLKIWNSRFVKYIRRMAVIFWNLRVVKLIRKNFWSFLFIFSISIYNIMRIFEIKDYNIVLQFKITFRSQLYYNLTKLLAQPDQWTSTIDFGIWNFGNIYYLMVLLILSIPLVFLIATAVLLIKPHNRFSQFIDKKYKTYSLLTIALELILTMKITSSLQIGNLFAELVQFVKENFKFFADLFSQSLKGIIDDVENILLLFPPLLVILFFGVIIYYLTKKDVKVTLLSIILLTITSAMGPYWEATVQTLVLIFFASFFCIVTGVPLGIFSAKNDTFYNLIRPILDFMQTLPSFVYLIPAAFILGIGNASAIVAIYIFAMPPAVRLTNLGLRQVPVELIEVAESYGSTSWQKLVKVELPVAYPTILAGVNQVIMLSLSMVVIAALIGSQNLGTYVVRALQQLKLGLGFEAGLAIVLIAMLLDRVTGSRQRD